MTKDEIIKKNLDIHVEWMKYVFEHPDVLDRIPKGAVLVYESAVACNKSTKNIMGQGCGHIEVKLGDGSDTKGFKYASDYKSGKSILDGSTGHKYRLVGVMIKPDL